VLAALLAHAPVGCAPAKSPPPECEPVQTQTGGDASVIHSIDAAIAALANRNRPPTLPKGEGKPLRDSDKTYDPSEDDRVREAIDFLVQHAEEALPQLVEHFDDERYCITYGSSDEYWNNYSIVDVCYSIVSDCLTEPYFKTQPDTEWPMNRMWYPSVTQTPSEKSWFKSRANKKLYELQIEICDWAITEMPEMVILTAEEKSEWVHAIEKTRDSLRKTKKAIPIEKFGTRMDISRSRASPGVEIEDFRVEPDQKNMSGKSPAKTGKKSKRGRS
jgi:hypothetical protein